MSEMKVIGAGLPRTGTLSQKVALEQLGFGPCYHMVDLMGDLAQTPKWEQALEGNGRWDEIFEGFQSTVDWPASYYYRELAEVYPDAKVVLGVRDGDSWARSMHETIWAFFYGDVLMRHVSFARREVDPTWKDWTDMLMEMWRRSGLMNEEATTEEWMSAAIDRYHAEVRETVPSDRLLVWSVSEGWGPLCEFLEVPVPDAPFPKLNDGAEFAGRVIEGSMAALDSWWEENRPEPGQ
jgi:hypothetical protein